MIARFPYALLTFKDKVSRWQTICYEWKNVVVFLDFTLKIVQNEEELLLKNVEVEREMDMTHRVLKASKSGAAILDPKYS